MNGEPTSTRLPLIQLTHSSSSHVHLRVHEQNPSRSRPEINRHCLSSLKYELTPFHLSSALQLSRSQGCRLTARLYRHSGSVGRIDPAQP